MNKLKTMSYYQANFPQLTFDNDGYQYLSKEVKESHKSQIVEIESILKRVIEGFVCFNNFKPLRKGGFEVRCQQHWEGDTGFIGVNYISMTRIDDCIEEFNSNL